MIMLALKLRAFQAIKDQKLSERFLEGHRQVLRDYGITNITTNTDNWMFNPSIYAVVAENEEGELVGGIRVQMANGVNPLPVEKAIGHMDPRIYDVIRKYSDEGVGELNALWNAKSVAGYGISLLMTRAGISIVNQVNCNILVGICADYTLKMFRKVGFVVDDSLGDHGNFVYPNENYIARVLGILNAKNMETAEQEDRERILDLRQNPVQTAVEEGPKDSLIVNYNLIIPK